VVVDGLSATTPRNPASFNDRKIQMPKFQPVHDAEPVLLSENRQALAALIADRDAMMLAANAEVERSAKLATVHDAVEPARAALLGFDAQTAIAMSNWAAGNFTSLPKSDSARRAELAAELADAELSSGAAKAAQDSCQAAVERISAQLNQINAKVRELAKVIAIEEASELLLPQIASAIASAESLRYQLEAARAEAIDGDEYGRTTLVTPALAAFDNARLAAESRPFEPAVNPFKLGWRKYVAALTEDASVDFDGAQQMDVAPVIVHSQPTDPVSAAAAAVESFQSTGFIR
jgi:hypothetical protein